MLRAGGKEVRVKRENRAGDDGYRSGLLPGLRASGDAEALAAGDRLRRTVACWRSGPRHPDLYGEVRRMAEEDLERATWTCFLIAYLSPLDGDNPFPRVRLVLAAVGDGVVDEGMPDSGDASHKGDASHGDALHEVNVPDEVNALHVMDAPDPDEESVLEEEGALDDLGRMPLGPRTSHDPARGTGTLLAYRHWAERAGSQQRAFEGRSRVESGAALRARLRAPGVARLRSHGAL